MDELNDIVSDLGGREDRLIRYKDILSRVQSSEEVSQELDLQFNQRNVDWAYLRDISDDQMDEVTQAFESVLEASDTETMREEAKNVAEILYKM